MNKLNTVTASEAAARIAAGDMSSEAYVRSFLDRIAEREATVGAWSFVSPEEALARAEERDAQSPLGPLHGIPVAVKDIIDTVDMPTEYGSPIYAGNLPAWDASCVALIRAAGGIVPGKTVTAEFATYAPGKTANPRNPAHTPGGSSSGSAAAVADGMAPLALGTQTAGSVIRPAAYCGVVGYKPTYGWIGRAGVKPCSETLDTLGVFANCVEDAALLVSVLAGRPSLAGAKHTGAPPKVGFCKTYEWPNALPETVEALESAKARLAAAGSAVREFSLPEAFSQLALAQTRIMAFECARSLAYEYAQHREKLSAKLRDLIGQGLEISHETYLGSLSLGAACRAILDVSWGDLDVILAPSVPGEAPAGLEATGDPVFNRIWTFLGVPCIHLPTGTGPRGLPVGVQLVGRHASDETLLASARWIHSILKS